MPGISEPSGSVHLALVFHFHQPVGNFCEVFERVTEQCYRPVIELLVAHPDIKCHLHFNGILLAWFDEHHPDLISSIGEMVRRGSVEMITGGHQEPILGVLPERDAVGQVLAMNDELERRFGERPVGAWLTERVYEPHLPTRLHRAGVRYIPLDNTLLAWSGLDVEEMTGAFETEDGGRPLIIFPAAKALRYSIPFRPHDESLDWLHGLRSVDGEPPLAVYADDAEKFGEWPGTHEWVWEKGWLAGYFDRLAHDERVVTVHLRDELERRRPVGMVYPPAASYQEMTVWALPTPARHRLETLIECAEVKAADRDDEVGVGDCSLADALPFVRGGHWRGFLAKYPEAARMHRRMLAASRRFDALTDEIDDPRLDEARRDLYGGQCNDAYWHGSFGGVYLAHLRREVQARLIRCERLLDRIARGAPDWIEVTGRGDEPEDPKRLHARNEHVSVAVDPDHGGALVAWDLREACEDWINVMQRHEEPFHRLLRERHGIEAKGAKRGSTAGAEPSAEPGADHARDADSVTDSVADPDDGIATIHGALQIKDDIAAGDLEVDRHSRVGGLTWVAPAGLVLDDVLGLDHEALLLSGRWSDQVLVAGPDAASRDAGAAGPEFSPTSLALSWERPDLRVRKTYRIGRHDASIEMDLRCENDGDAPLQILSEWNLLCSWTGEDLELLEGESATKAPNACRRGVERLTLLGGGGRRLDIECSPAATLSWSCVHTVSSSEAGLEKMGQGTALVIGWPLEERLEARLRMMPSSPPRGDTLAS